MFKWQYHFNRKLDAKKEGDEGGGSGNPPPEKKKEGDEGEKGAGESEGEEGEGDQLDVDKLPDSAKKLIKTLRDENAKHRTKNKELGDKTGKLKQALVEAGIIENDEEAPEEKIKNLSEQNQGLVLKSVLLEAAVEHSVPKGSLKYFQFLINEKLEGLQDGEEVTDEDIAALAEEAKGFSGSGKSGGNSSVDGKGKGSAPAPGGNGAVTVDQFVLMNIAEKSVLFQKSPDVYNKLMSQARAKRLL